MKKLKYLEKYVDQDMQKYLDYLKFERKLSNNTYSSYKTNLIKLNEYFNPNINDAKELKKISKYYTRDNIKQFLYNLELTNRSKAHYLTVLKSYYAFLQTEEYIKINPTDSIRMPKLEKKLPNYLSIDEVNKILDIKMTKPNDYRNKAMLELLYGSGMRISELINLTLSQLDFKDEQIRIMGKGKKERIVPLNDECLEYLALYINDYRNFLLKTKTSDYIFINNFGNKISRQGFFKILKKICLKAGITKDVSPHVLRHSFATHLLNNGADLRIIQELLGHENLVTTEIYAHLQNKKIKDDYENHPRFKS